MNPGWVLVHKPDIKRFEASFPGNTAPQHLASYVRVQVGPNAEFLATSLRRGAAGTQVWVSDDAFTGLAESTPITFASASAARYQWERLWRDPKKRLTRWGFGIGLFGLLLEAGFALGQTTPLLILDQGVYAAAVWFSWLLKIGGLVLAFINDDVLKAD